MPGLLKGACRALGRTAAGFRSRSGSVNIVFGLSLIPLVGIVGLGVDYGVTITNKTKLDTALDAAALAAVVTAKTYIRDNQSQSNVTSNALAAGSTQAVNAFNANMGKIPFAQVTLSAPQVTRSGQTLNSSLTYTATVQNNFGRIFNVPSTTFSNTANASVDLAGYLDFYLMVDVSGSMGLPTDAVSMAKLAAGNRDMFSDYKQGCQFACHFPGYTGWTYAVDNKIPLRSDAVNSAVCSLISRASNPTVPNQYRIGIYPFINELAPLSALSSNTSTLSTAAQCNLSRPLAFTNLLDTGATQLYTGNDPRTGIGAGGTHFEQAFPQMQALVAKFGDGSSSSNSKPFIFLVTDGMQNDQHFFVMKSGDYAYPGSPSKFSGYSDASWDGSKPAQIDPALCTPLKNAGATISVLYIPYNKIDFVDLGGGVAWENNRVNGFSPTLATPLKACASPGYFYTANSPADITAALNAMFDQALRVARLTQ